jgi:hypothetical protein
MKQANISINYIVYFILGLIVLLFVIVLASGLTGKMVNIVVGFFNSVF